MAAQRFRVGIVGLQPPRSWAARAHIPALASLPGHFEPAIARCERWRYPRQTGRAVCRT